MRQLVLTLLWEDSGLRNYGDSEDCPIARALKRRHLKRVFVGSSYWLADKPVLFGLFSVPVGGQIDKDSRRAAMSWSMKAETSSKVIRLPAQTLQCLPWWSHKNPLRYE